MKHEHRTPNSPFSILNSTFASNWRRWLNTLGCCAELWREEDGSPVVTDNGNYLVRCHFPDGIADPYGLACALAERPGIFEHGLFLDMASTVILAGPEGVRVLERAS